MVARQRLRVGPTYAGKLVTIALEDTHLRVTHDGQELGLFPRTRTDAVTRFKAYAQRRPNR
jgi:hypothetical protein